MWGGKVDCIIPARGLAVEQQKSRLGMPNGRPQLIRTQLDLIQDSNRNQYTRLSARGRVFEKKKLMTKIVENKNKHKRRNINNN